MTPTTRNELFQQCESNISAEVALFFRRNPRLQRDREEVYQAVCLRVLEKLDTFDPARGSLSTWAQNVARRAVVEFFDPTTRSPRKNPTPKPLSLDVVQVEDRSLQDRLVAPELGPHELLERADVQVRVELMLAGKLGTPAHQAALQRILDDRGGPYTDEVRDLAREVYCLLTGVWPSGRFMPPLSAAERQRRYWANLPQEVRDAWSARKTARRQEAA